MGLAFTCTQLYITLTLSSVLTHTDPRQLAAKLCEFCVLGVCRHTSWRTNRAWQAEGKQSADVCVGIVSATTLRRHFSLIPEAGGFSSFHIKYLQREGHRSGLDEIGEEDKDYCMDPNTTFFEKPAEEMRRFSLPFPLAMLLQEGHFFVWCVCGILSTWAQTRRAFRAVIAIPCTLHKTRGRPFGLVRHFWRAISVKGPQIYKILYTRWQEQYAAILSRAGKAKGEQEHFRKPFGCRKQMPCGKNCTGLRH